MPTGNRNDPNFPYFTKADQLRLHPITVIMVQKSLIENSLYNQFSRKKEKKIKYFNHKTKKQKLSELISQRILSIFLC